MVGQTGILTKIPEIERKGGRGADREKAEGKGVRGERSNHPRNTVELGSAKFELWPVLQRGEAGMSSKICRIALGIMQSKCCPFQKHLMVSELRSMGGISFSVLRIRCSGAMFTFLAVAPPCPRRRGACCLPSCAEL